jgi:hypothetical protein
MFTGDHDLGVESGFGLTLGFVGTSLTMKTVAVDQAIARAKIVTPIRGSLGRRETTKSESYRENVSRS